MATIVGHAATLEEAIESVKNHARAYVVAKNEPVLHRGADGAALKFTERVHYYTRDSTEVCHQIDVYRQQTHKVKGWTGSSYQEDSLLVRRFAYNEYAVEAAAPFVAVALSDDEINRVRAAHVKEMGLRHTNTVGGFTPDVIAEIRENKAFKKLQHSSAQNRLPPPCKHTEIVDSADEEDEQNSDDRY